MKARSLATVFLAALCECVAQTGDISAPNPIGDADGSVPSETVSLSADAGREASVVSIATDAAEHLDGGAGGQAPYCVVRQMLTLRCVRCHSNPPTGGAPMSLLNYADLLVPALSNSSRSVAEVALARIQDNGAPMPPSPAPPATRSEVQALQDWINAGTPQTICSGSPQPGGDAATGNGAGADAGRDAGRGGVVDAGRVIIVEAGVDAGGLSDPFSVTRCTSNTRWTSGNNFNMRPGEPCRNCHSNYTIMGTVYPTGHEPNDCNGVNGSTTGAVVVITDANGVVRNLPVNPVGNFELSAAVATPFHAKVTYAGRERAMTAAQTNGNCNSCHTPTGSGSAPGRIVLP